MLINSFFIYNEFYYFSLLPLAFILFYFISFKLESLFFLIVAFTPFSLNLEALSIGGIGLYLPTEPILLCLLLIFLFKLIQRKEIAFYSISYHPITIIILLQIFWIFITSITSEFPIVSFKFLLARLWFILPVFFLGLIIFSKSLKNIYKFLWAFLIPLTLVLVYTLFSHALHGFSEEAGHWVMWPFFKDHTSYGAIIALFFPIVVGMMTDSKIPFNTRNILKFIFLIFSVALFYSYTRAAWLSVVAAGVVYLLFYFKIKFSWLLISGISLLIFLALNFTEISYMLNKNNAEHTTEDFSERIESMSNISSDASNLERFNRWNCAVKLFQERPLVGWGPGTYSFVYAPFQDASDLTIISTNFGDGGNAHSEYLGPLAEQGFIGMFLMVLLVFFIFYRAGVLYIKLEDARLKRIVMMLMLGLVTYFTHGVLNNYLDTDKASVPVWAFIAIIVSLDMKFRISQTSNVSNNSKAL